MEEIGLKNTYKLLVNGMEKEVYCHPAKPLLDVLRDDLQLTASKECCGKGECGSCTVLIDGLSVCSCLVLVSQTEKKEIITCEGIGTSDNMDIIQEAFVLEGATQCGYCTPGFIVSAKLLLNEVKTMPTTDQIKQALGGNLCRCTGYTKIIKAVETAARNKLSMVETKS
jgi:aerobic carbon-monoxide dehydrogenase small subunit